MKATKNKLMLLKGDYDLLVKYVHGRMSPLSAERRNAEQLYEELSEADVFEKEEDLPKDVIRLNSMVEVVEQGSKRRLSFQIVEPSKASGGNKRLSLFAPLAIALMGYRKGQVVHWDMPAGRKTFEVVEVKRGN